MNKEKLLNALFLVCISFAVIFALLFIGVNCRYAVSRSDYLIAVHGPNAQYDDFIKEVKFTSNIFMWLAIGLGGAATIFKVMSVISTDSESAQ